MGQQKLTKAEEEVMMLLWAQHEPVTVSQLIDQMQTEPKPPHSTISTIIRTLERKGFVDHKTYGRTHAYFPLVDKKSYTRFSLKKLVTNYFKGSPNELVSFLVQENDLDLKELGQLIDKLENQKDE